MVEGHPKTHQKEKVFIRVYKIPYVVLALENFHLWQERKNAI